VRGKALANRQSDVATTVERGGYATMTQKRQVGRGKRTIEKTGMRVSELYPKHMLQAVLCESQICHGKVLLDARGAW